MAVQSAATKKYQDRLVLLWHVNQRRKQAPKASSISFLPPCPSQQKGEGEVSPQSLPLRSTCCQNPSVLFIPHASSLDISYRVWPHYLHSAALQKMMLPTLVRVCPCKFNIGTVGEVVSSGPRVLAIGTLVSVSTSQGISKLTLKRYSAAMAASDSPRVSFLGIIKEGT